MEEEKIEKGFARKMTTGDKIRCIVWCILVVLFAIWTGSFLPLLALLYVIDLYWTHFINWYWWKDIKNGFVRSVMSWIDALVFAICAVWILQNFFFQNFQIPTTSLEKSMLAGDYLLVSKYHYGPRIPMTPLSLPLFQHTITIGDMNLGKSYIESVQNPYRRIAGLKDIERNDIVVFNYPNGDTVATKHQDDDYYRLKFHHGVQALHANKALYGDIIYRPVDRRENYVKRCIGLPGEELKIVDNEVFIDGKQIGNPRYLQHNYFVITRPGTSIAERTWKNLGVYNSDLVDITSPDSNFALGLEPDSVSGALCSIYVSPLTEEMKANGVTELYRNVEIPLAKVLVRMENRGVLIDDKTLGQTAQQMNAEMAEIEREIREIAGETINISSPKQVGELLFDKLQLLEKPKKTRKTAKSKEEAE